MIKLVIVVLPAPVEPTNAIFWPGCAYKDTLNKTCFSGIYPKSTPSRTTLPSSFWRVVVPSPWGCFHKNKSVLLLTDERFKIDNDYLYFVADKNGKVYYSKTLAEHNQKIAEIKKNGDWIW